MDEAAGFGSRRIKQQEEQWWGLEKISTFGSEVCVEVGKGGMRGTGFTFRDQNWRWENFFLGRERI